MSQARYDLACATLQQLGLWPQEPQRHLDAAQAPVYTEQDVIDEVSLKSYFTLDTVDSGDYKLGDFMRFAGEFLLANDKITSEDLDNVNASIDNTYISRVKEWAKN